MRWHVEFYNRRSDTLAHYRVDASTPDAAVLAGRRAVLAEHPLPRTRRRKLSLFARAERAAAHDDSGWTLYRMRKDDGPAPGSSESPVPSAMAE